MRRLVVATSVLVYMHSFWGQSLASDLDLIPLGDFGRYSQALATARSAAAVQSGFDGGYERYKHLLSDKAFDLIKDSGFANQLGATFFVYKIYRDRSLSFPLGNKRLTLQPDRFEFRLEF